MVTEVEKFLSAMLPRQLAAEQALCRGDAQARSGTWSPNDPVTIFGASVPLCRGWNEVSSTARLLAGHFSDLQDYQFELVAAGASGDLAYTVSFEHKIVDVDGETRTYTLRLTHVYRREEGVWKIAHRHGDHLTPKSAPASAS